MNPERAVSYRKQAGTLIESVLAEEITPRTAINTWPTYGNQDLSVRVAYTMLWFFEADEDRHKAELFYPDVQVKALKEAAQWLKQGEPLPLRLISEYDERIAPELYNPHRSWHEPLMWLMTQLHTMRCILETHPLVSRYSHMTRAKRAPRQAVAPSVPRRWPQPPPPVTTTRQQVLQQAPQQPIFRQSPPLPTPQAPRPTAWQNPGDRSPGSYKTI